MPENAAWGSLEDLERETSANAKRCFTTPASHCASLRVAEYKEGSESGSCLGPKRARVNCSSCNCFEKMF